MAAQDQEQDVEAPGSEGLGPGQYHIDPVLVVKAVPGLPGSKEEQRQCHRGLRNVWPLSVALRVPAGWAQHTVLGVAKVQRPTHTHPEAHRCQYAL